MNRTRSVAAAALAATLAGCPIEAPRYEHAQTVEAFSKVAFDDPSLDEFRRDGVVFGARLIDGHPSLTLHFGSDAAHAVHVESVEIAALDGSQPVAVPAGRDHELGPVQGKEGYRTRPKYEVPIDRETYAAMGTEGYRITVAWHVVGGTAGEPTVLQIPRTTAWTFGV